MISTENRRLMAFGCSVTHGCELVSGAYHPENVQDSYPNVLARQLGIGCENHAIPGASNDQIFHDMMSADFNDAIVLVCWTSLVRESWRDQDLNWFFIPNWGACFRELKHDTVEVHPLNDRVVTDDRELLDPAASYYDFFMRYKTDGKEYQRKLENYHRSFRAVMHEKNIPYIELSCIYTHLPAVTNIDGEWTRWGRHPDRQEHQQIADLLCRTYFE